MFTDLGTQILKLANTDWFICNRLGCYRCCIVYYLPCGETLKLEAITSHIQGSIELIKSLLSLKSLILQIGSGKQQKKPQLLQVTLLMFRQRLVIGLLLILTLFATIGSAVYMLVKSKQKLKSP